MAKLIPEFNEDRFQKVPASAGRFTCEFALGDNGEGSKTAPIRLIARSNGPVEHPFWGRVVHDMDGLILNKTRLSIDYCHDNADVIGYLNKFEKTDEGLVTSGALVPFKESDRATEIIFKLKAGIPYQSSINFSGDGIKIEFIDDNQVTEVNGEMFEGPGIVIREWPLRNIAICPLGADENTEASLLSDSGKTFSCEIVKQGEVEMANSEETTKVVETEVTETEEKHVGEEKDVTEDVLNLKDEEKEEEKDEDSEEAKEDTEAVDTEEVTQEISQDRQLFKNFVEEFGSDLAGDYFAEGKSMDEAKDAHRQFLKDENKQLKDQAGKAELSLGEDAPVSVDTVENKSEVTPKEMEERKMKGLSDAQAEYAATVKIRNM